MRILFFGDSITYSGRLFEDDRVLGSGYPRFVEATLGFEQPNQHTFINRGISGNRIVDLYARIKCDVLNLKPDVISILIGVNDVWHELLERPNGVTPEKFFKVYSMLIEEIKEALPNIKIMIMEPFCLKAPATEGNWEYFSTEVPKRAEMAKKIAEKYNLTYIPLQEKFDKLCELAPATYWLEDGVHPTAQGHKFLEKEWIEAYKKLF